MMLTQRISTLAHDLARQCHVVGGGGGEGVVHTGDKSCAGKKASKETTHRYSRRKGMCCVQVYTRVGVMWDKSLINHRAEHRF